MVSTKTLLLNTIIIPPSRIKKLLKNVIFET